MKKYPSFWRVGAAMLYDGIVLLSFLLIASALLLPLGMGYGQTLYPLYKALLFLSVFFYFSWCWTRGGQTVGMRIWRFRLMSAKGYPVRWPQATARFAYALFSFAVFGLGFVWILLSRQRKSWHDMLSGTRLIMNAEPGEATNKKQQNRGRQHEQEQGQEGSDPNRPVISQSDAAETAHGDAVGKTGNDTKE